MQMGNSSIEPIPDELHKPKLKIFSLAVLKSATNNFSPDAVIGEGSFGRVYKGFIDEDDAVAPPKSAALIKKLKAILPCQNSGSKTAVAVKRWISSRPRGHEFWQSEVNFLATHTHPNLIKLLGYCCEDEELLLVYEFMPNRSLNEHLFNHSTRRSEEPLSWDTRIDIALGAARGLAFLHNLKKPIIHRDFHCQHILLDGTHNPKLTGFGIAVSGPADGESYVETSVMGSYGNLAPEYCTSGRLYVKSDVFSFGVVLLEMMTGLRAGGMEDLLGRAKSRASNNEKVKAIVDTKMEGQFSEKAAYEAVQLALGCLESDPNDRPSMVEVVEALQQIKDHN